MVEQIKRDLISKLDYLGLNLENINTALYDFNPLNFNVSRLNNDKDHKVFRFIPIDKIEILLTPSLRSDSVREKYSKAEPLRNYLVADGNEEALEKYTTFLKMLQVFSIADVENVSNLQTEMEKSEPFRVRYNKEHLWHIYYSEATDRYFMLVCTKESTFAEFFYLLKKKIELAKKPEMEIPKIFVPINYINYSEIYLNRDEIIDLENYLWLFTKNWPSIFEVYDKGNKLSLQIIGETFVYDTVKSTYKLKLCNSDEAIKFYKLLKALFIMQTELKDYFSFTTKIDSKNGLEIYYDNIRITYENLTEFIKNKYDDAKIEIEEQNKSIKKLDKELKKIKNRISEKEKEYIQKQREIGAFLECKKTFMGKMKYFFKSNKMNKKIRKQVEEEVLKKGESEIVSVDKEVVDLKAMNTYMEDRKFYTIEDLVVIYSMLDKGKKKYQSLNQDLRAAKATLYNYEKKVENAEIYISEIDKHKKSIFDFWKFTSKDEQLALEMGEELDSKEARTIKKVFDFEMDFENLGIQMDRLQRRKFSKEEMDSIFIAKGNLISILNNLRNNQMDEKQLKTALKKLKEEFNNDRLYINEEAFDIFGNISDDNRKTKYIGSRSHRENEKSKYKILNINKDIDVFDFTERLQAIRTYIEGAIPKVITEYDMTLYKVIQIPHQLNENNLEIMNINIEKELEEYEDKGEGALNLLKINFKEGMPLIYYSNIMFYDNTNQTLPEGMDVSTNVLVDCSKFDFKLVNTTKFRTNNYFRESNNLILPKSKDLFVYEYDVELKKDKEKKSKETE